MANWGRSKGTAGDKPNFPGLDPENITGTTAADGKEEGAQHVGWVNTVDTGSGSVTGIEELVGGSGYTEATVTITGDGIGATAEAVLDDGAVDDIIITSGGAGYTEATITITGQEGFSGTPATADAVITNRVKKETLVAFGSMTA